MLKVAVAVEVEMQYKEESAGEFTARGLLENCGISRGVSIATKATRRI